MRGPLTFMVDFPMQPTRGPLLVLVACHGGKATAVEGGVRVGPSWGSRMPLDAGHWCRSSSHELV
jgi:hypothetical protein